MLFVAAHYLFSPFTSHIVPEQPVQAKVCDPVLRIGTGPLTFSPPLSSWEGAHLGLLGPYLQVVETCLRNEKTDKPGDIIFTFRL